MEQERLDKIVFGVLMSFAFDSILVKEGWNYFFKQFPINVFGTVFNQSVKYDIDFIVVRVRNKGQKLNEPLDPDLCYSWEHSF